MNSTGRTLAGIRSHRATVGRVALAGLLVSCVSQSAPSASGSRRPVPTPALSGTASAAASLPPSPAPGSSDPLAATPLPPLVLAPSPISTTGHATPAAFRSWPGLDAEDRHGLVYDSALDHWTALPQAPMTSAGGQAVWTGAEVIGVTPAREAAAYDPGKRSWRALSAPPFETKSIQLMWTGSVVPAFARPGDAPAPVAYASLDPTQDQWLGPGETPLFNSQSDRGVWAGDRSVFLSGEPSDPNAAPPSQSGSISSASFDPIVSSGLH